MHFFDRKPVIWNVVENDRREHKVKAVVVEWEISYVHAVVDLLHVQIGGGIFAELTRAKPLKKRLGCKMQHLHPGRNSVLQNVFDHQRLQSVPLESTASGTFGVLSCAS